MADKPKYAEGSPEMHLFRQIESNQHLATAHANDAERYAQKAEVARDNVRKFTDALRKLDPTF